MVTIEMQDDILHTDESPHCDDPTCPCWTVLEEPAVDAFLAIGRSVKRMNEQIIAVNHLLEQGEPANISVDEHAGYTGYKPQYIIDAMNEVFGIGGWGFSEIGSEVINAEKGGLAVAQVSVWLKGIEFQPSGWGQNRVTRGDIGDARKGAQTDAIKKALSYFSIGNRAYHGLLDKKAPQRPTVASSSVTPPGTSGSVKATSAQVGAQDGANKGGTRKEVYDAYMTGKSQGMWKNASGFYAAASVSLGTVVSAENVNSLTAEQLALVLTPVPDAA